MTGIPLAALLVLAAALGPLLEPFLEPGSKEAQTGRNRYQDEAFVEAVEHFSRARELEAEPGVNLNLGAAAYRAQNYSLAADAFGAAAGNPDLAPGRAHYDLGNARYQSGDLEGAVAAYRDALRRDPTNADARYNYELVLKELQSGEQEQEQEREEPSDGEDDSQPSDSQGSDAPPDSSRQSNPEEEENQQESEEDGTQSPESERQDSEAQQGEDGENRENSPGENASESDGDPENLLTPEEAARLLNAVTPEERELIKSRLRSTRRKKVEKDW